VECYQENGRTEVNIRKENQMSKVKQYFECENCGNKRLTRCTCQLPDPKSQTQKRKKHRKELI
jgi:predicted RNA-binding Zn-ribbon protein involved in translation (DUF1610 family)